MLKRVIIGICLMLTAICGVYGAYGDREPPIIVDVNSSHEKINPTSFAIVPLSYQEGDALFESLAEMVDERLSGKGYTRSSPAEAELVVILAYNLYTDDSDIYSPPVYTRVLRLSMLDRADYAVRKITKVYEASTVSRGTYSNLAALLPLHLNAVFYDFPGPVSSDRAYKVTGMNETDVSLSHSTATDPLFQYSNSKFSFTIE